MRFLMGVLGASLLVIACLFVRIPWMATVYGIAGVVTIVCCRPMKSKWMLGILGLFASILMFVMFACFFNGVAIAHTDSNWYELEGASRYFVYLFGGFVMMLAVSEYSCWMKGRDVANQVSLAKGLKDTGKRLRRVSLSD